MGKADRAIALAVVAEWDGDWGVARSLLLRAIAEEPGDDRAWALLARAAGDPELALACLEEAVTLNPANEYAGRELRRRKDGGGVAGGVGAPSPPAAPRLGEVMVQRHALDWVKLMRAVLWQRALRAEGVRRPLGELLVEMGAVDEPGLRRAVEDQWELRSRVA
jgi:hypothetical protein